MKPTRLHYLYAYKWPGWICIVVVPLLCVALVARELGPPPALFPLETDARSYFLLLACAWLLGWASCALLGPFVLGPIYFHRAQLNGAPFQMGDSVEIRGRVDAAPVRGYRVSGVVVAHDEQQVWTRAAHWSHV